MLMLARLAFGLVLAGCLFSSAALGQGVPSGAKKFFRSHATALAKAGAATRVPGVVSDVVPVEFNSADMLRLRPGDVVELALPNAAPQAVVFELAQAHGGDVHSWIGYFRDRGNNNRVMITTGPSGSYGVIEAPEGTYRIVPHNGRDWLVDMSREQLHLPLPSFENDALIPPPEAKGAALATGQATYEPVIPGVNHIGFEKAAPAPQYNVDLMVVVTRTLAQKLGAGLMTRLNFLVARANTSYADSEIAITMRLVNVTVVDYSDAGSDSTALDAITPVGGSFDAATFGNIETIRTQAKADVVAFMRDGSSFGGSGVAWVGTTAPNPLRMYSVTTGCVAGCESVFIHEVGHNMGNMHDRATVAWQKGGTTAYGQGAQTYSFGYAFCASGTLTCNPTLPNDTAGACTTGQQPECPASTSNFAEIMAYFQGSASRIYKFSNPAITCAAPGGDGVPRPCGISEAAVGVTLTTGSANTVLSMNNNRLALSGIKTGDANPPGLLYFTNTGFSGSESGGSVIFTVARGNGSGGAVSATYSVASGTATAGTDFTATSGTVSWADGDTANKTFSIPVTNDALVEGIETFTATLSAPTGSASIAYPNTALGSILEPWPPGGTAPPGFSSSLTPASPWAVAADSYDPAGGDTSSYKSAAFADAATGTSSTQYIGNFNAGTVAFSYRVSSFPGNGFFEFLIDGVLALQDSGDTGQWKSSSTSISAGTHTLEWRYRKVANYACRFTYFVGTPPPPYPYPNCQDRAWIDTVSMPVVPVVPAAITITKAGTGTGTVTSTPAGISCGATCTANVNTTTFLALTPTPAAGSVFTGWSGGGGACAGTGTCYFTVSAPTSLTATFDLPSVATPRVVNISTRMQVLTGNNVLIGGFIIGGTSTKNVVIRARGPSLTAAGVPNALANPVLQIFSGATQIASNDNWQTDANAGLLGGYAPGNALESALYMTLGPGAYTAIVTGAGGTTGVGLIEVFEVDHPEVPLVNIATRGQVLTGNDVMIGGFIIQGNSPQTVVVRARGPSLTAQGVPGALANPMLQLFSGQAQIASNDNWQAAANAAAIQASGFAPADPLESAILVTLNPGAYTAIVTGVGGATGVGIVEVFAQ